MVMKYIFITTAFLTLSLCSYSQEENEVNATNTLFVEVGGNAGLYSINYDKILAQRSRLKLSIRIGVSIFPQPLDPGIFIQPIVPIEVNGFYGNKHHIEIGISYGSTLYPGYTLGEEKKAVLYHYSIVGRLGYRYQKKEGGLFMRIAYTPWLYDSASEDSFLTWGAVAIGKSF